MEAPGQLPSLPSPKSGTDDRVMRMKLEIEGEVWHIISCYAPQVGCTQEEKDEFWEHMDAEMQAVPRSERLVVAGDLNCHVGRDRDGYDGVHGGHGLGVRNEEGIKIMDFATAYQMRLMHRSRCRTCRHHRPRHDLLC